MPESSRPTSRSRRTRSRSSSETFPTPAAHATPRPRRDGTSADPYKRISPPEYFEKLAGIVVPRDGLVSCPAPEHEDRNPSCSVGTEPGAGMVLPLRELRGARRDL